MLSELNRSLAKDIVGLQERLRLEVPEVEFRPAQDAADPVDPEKRALRARVAALEDQEKAMAERFRGLHATTAELRKEVYKLSQRLKYKMASEQNARLLTGAAASLHQLAVEVDVTIDEGATAEDIIQSLLRELAAARKENFELQERCQEIRLYSAGAEAGDAAAAAAAAERLRAASDGSSQADEEEGREREALERRSSSAGGVASAGAATGAVAVSASSSPAPGERERSGTTTVIAGAAAAAAAATGGGGGDRENGGEERLELHGWLQKLGGKNNNKWQRRHFSLAFAEESNIYTVVYRAKDRGPVKGRVALPWCTVRRGAAALQEAGLKPSVLDKVEAECMLLLCPRMVEKKKKNYVLAAASKAELKMWVDALETAACFLPSAEDILRTGTYKLLDQSQV